MKLSFKAPSTYCKIYVKIAMMNEEKKKKISLEEGIVFKIVVNDWYLKYTNLFLQNIIKMNSDVELLSHESTYRLESDANLYDDNSIKE